VDLLEKVVIRERAKRFLIQEGPAVIDFPDRAQM
jgi:hypothetical protein